MNISKEKDKIILKRYIFRLQEYLPQKKHVPQKQQINCKGNIFVKKSYRYKTQILSILPFINYKDIFGLFMVGSLYTIQLFIGIFSLSHPDNAFQVNELVTPLHIVPEWYFLSYYTMLKAIPNKNAGFIILLTSILILMLFPSLVGSPNPAHRR